jgi:hypothetical protein
MIHFRFRLNVSAFRWGMIRAQIELQLLAIQLARLQ